MAETHNIHAFTNREIEHRKRMDEIEACVERQQTFDLASELPTPQSCKNDLKKLRVLKISVSSGTLEGESTSDELMGELRELVDIFNQSTELKSKMELSPDNMKLWKELQRRAQNISKPKKQIIADLLARLRNIYLRP